MVRWMGFFTKRRRDFSRFDKAFTSRFLTIELKIVNLPPLRVLDALLTRIYRGPIVLKNNPPLGLRLRSLRSPLRVSLASLDFTRDPEQVEGRGVKRRVETHSKAICFIVGAHSRAAGFVNEAG